MVWVSGLSGLGNRPHGGGPIEMGPSSGGGGTNGPRGGCGWPAARLSPVAGVLSVVGVLLAVPGCGVAGGDI